MTVNQKAAAQATLELRLDNLRSLLEQETDPEWRADLNESLEDLKGAYAAIAPSKLWAKEEALHMRQKKSLASVALELAAVLLVTVLAFAWGVRVAQAQRGYNAIGGEFVFLLIPAMYYTGKQVILDWIADLRKQWKRYNHG